MNSEQGKIEGQARSSPGTLERVFVVLVLLFGAGAFFVLIQPEGLYNQAGGGRAFEVIWAITYLVTFCLILFHIRGAATGFLTELPITAFPAMALLSTVWSDNPGITFRRSIALWLTMMFGYYMARRFTLREQLHLIAWVCGISIFFSFPFGLLHIGRKEDLIEGAWNGIFGQKNVLGGMMALSVLVFLVLRKVEPEKRWRMRMGILAALVLLVLSRSVGALVITTMVFLLVPMAGILRKGIARALTGMALVGLCGTTVVFWVIVHWGTFTGALGKGETMSGRLQLWVLCVVMALQKPWLGYGYSAFWLGMQGPSFRILRVLPSIFNSRAHNAFLQVWLELGLVGVGLLVIIFVVYIIRAALMFRRTAQPEAMWPLMILVFFFLYSLTETVIPGTNSISMMIFSSCMFASSAPLPESAGMLADRESRQARGLRKRSDIGGAVPEISSV
jgi:exopolysaccharide production protein ExoQ